MPNETARKLAEEDFIMNASLLQLKRYLPIVQAASVFAAVTGLRCSTKE